MGLKILHSADWHLDSPFAGFAGEQQRFLKQEQSRIPEKVAQMCRREGCDLMLLSGDILDGKAGRETLEGLKRELGRCGVPVFIAPGNHDFVGPGSPWLEEDWPSNVFIFTGGVEAVDIAALDCRIYGGGFRSMDCPPMLERFRAEGGRRYTLGVFHGDPTQKASPYNPITAAQARDSGLQYLALGHIHKVGAFRAGQTLCAWPGCPMGRGWDETGEKGVCIVTLSDTAQVQAVSLDTPRFHQLEADITGGAEEALERLLPGAGGTDFFRIRLTGRAEVDLGALKARFAAFPNLELVDHTRPAGDLWADAGEDTLEGVYFRMLRQGMLEDPDNAEQYRLAAEISRSLLEGREVAL